MMGGGGGDQRFDNNGDGLKYLLLRVQGKLGPEDYRENGKQFGDYF